MADSGPDDIVLRYLRDIDRKLDILTDLDRYEARVPLDYAREAYRARQRGEVA